MEADRSVVTVRGRRKSVYGCRVLRAEGTGDILCCATDCSPKFASGHTETRRIEFLYQELWYKFCICEFCCFPFS